MNTNPNSKRILCFGDSLTFGKVPGPTKRYSSNERWTGVLQNLLGDSYDIIEEGLRGRTTDLNDPNSPGRNGLKYFEGCILSHLPLDLIIILLGTNDLKEKFNRSAKEIADIFQKYKKVINESCKYLEEREPSVLLVSPPLVDEVHALPEWGYKGAGEKAKEFALAYSNMAVNLGFTFLDLSKAVQPSNIDGVHLELKDNEKVANVIEKKVKSILG